MKIKVMLVLVCVFALILCGTVSAENTTSTATNSSSINLLQSPPTVNNTTNYPDPIISGVVLDNSTNTGLGNATVQVRDTNGNILAETSTNNDGTYSVGFINSNTVFTVIASKINYTINAKQIIVTPSSDPDDPNLYGTANFLLYGIPDYSGNASSYALNVGALPEILLDIYAGRSSAWVNSAISPYAYGEGIPLEVRLLSGSLLTGLLNVNSTGSQGNVTGGLLPDSIPSLEAALQSLGLDVGLLNATGYSSTNPPEANGGSSVASLGLALNLLILQIPVVDVDLITANSSVTPDIANSILISSSSVGVTDISILGGVLEIEALQSNATASVNGQPGGATADFDWSVADIKLLGVSILDNLMANLVVELPGVLRVSLGGKNEIAYADGTYAQASGDALNVELLGLLFEGIRLTIGHSEAEAQIPAGGLIIETDLEITKTVDNSNPNYGQNVTFTLTAHNNGPDSATNVIVSDPLPQGLTFVSATGAYDPTTGVWTIGNLANGATAILQIVAQVTAYATITNIAVINGDEPDQNVTNNEDNVTITTNIVSDLAITKNVDKITANLNDIIHYNITVTNNGPDPATNFNVNDLLPPELFFQSADTHGIGTYNNNTGIWNIPILASGSNAILDIFAQIIQSNIIIINNASVDQTNDPDTTNNNDTTTTTVNPIYDIAITKTVDKTPVFIGEHVTFTIIVRNNGPDTASDVQVTDSLPAGFEFISANSTHGTYNNATGIWNIGTISNNGLEIITIEARTLVTGTLINEAVVGESIYDPFLENNRANATVQVNSLPNIPIIPNSPDIPTNPNTPDIPANPDMPNKQTPLVQANTIPLKETGVHFGSILIAVLLIFAGMSLSRQK